MSPAPGHFYDFTLSIIGYKTTLTPLNKNHVSVTLEVRSRSLKVKIRNKKRFVCLLIFKLQLLYVGVGWLSSLFYQPLHLAPQKSCI